MCCKSTSLERRLRLLNVVVKLALFWCCDNWNLTKRQLAQLRHVQQRMMQKMIGLRVLASETRDEYVLRRASIVKVSFTRFSITSWDLVYHEHVFLWAGVVRRIGITDPERVTYHVLQYKNWACIQRIATAHRGRQLHGRRLRTWRWERPLYKFFDNRGISWEAAAADTDVWRACILQLVAWRSHTR